jgi:hypothetical protein
MREKEKISRDRSLASRKVIAIGRMTHIEENVSSFILFLLGIFWNFVNNNT